MASIRFAAFGGIKPAVASRLLKEQYATVAHNTKLVNGELSAFREPLLVKTDAEAKDLFVPPQMDSTCKNLLTFDECVSVVVPTTGECAGFELLAVFPDNDSAYLMEPDGSAVYPLGVKAPTIALNVELTSEAKATHAGVDARAYTYTWVDQFGIESAPAPASRTYKAMDGSIFTITGFGTPPSNAVACRLYRTGAKPETEGAADKPLVYNTTFQLVKEYDAADVSGGVTDNYDLMDIEGDSLETTLDCLPQSGLRGVVSLDNGYYAGFKGNVLYISERNQVWNWPAGQALEFDDRITGIAEVSDIVCVATSGSPLRVQVKLEQDNLLGEQTLTMMPEVVRSEKVLPGMSQRSICSTPIGAVYVSEYGLILIPPQGDAVNLTKDRIGEDAWPAYAPSRIMWVNGFVYGASPHKPHGIRVEVKSQSDGVSEPGDVCTVSMQASAVHAGRDGKAYFLNGGKVYRWDAGTSLLPYTWRSKVTKLQRITAFTAAKVAGAYASDVTFTAYKVDDRGALRASFTRTVSDSKPFRVRPGKRVTDHAFELTGTATIHELHIATSLAELYEG